MPTYDYRCEANGQVVEVSHRMNETISTWGELCARLNQPCGETAVDAPVYRMATGGHPIASGRLGSGMAAPSCSTGHCCPGGMCGI